ncbi:helix-turn-helix domain-containing protein [Nocardiopsis composta]|uniref:helix-turn-helix domain-containing protein n=1 Tax=Nocardiopsis composta TaxID=157465 RepID=UPI0028A7B05A|nr:helix-turn-helix transcriptional regulator [Nocardiopsis composta]
MTTGQVAKELGWQQTKVSRIETGSKKSVTTTDLDALLDFYGEKDPRLRSELRPPSQAAGLVVEVPACSVRCSAGFRSRGVAHPHLRVPSSTRIAPDCGLRGSDLPCQPSAHR